MRQLVLLGLRAETQFVNVVDDLAQIVAAGDFIFDFRENLADFIFDGVGPTRSLREAVQVGDELLIDEVAEVVAGLGGIVIKLAVLALGRGPAFPAVGFVENEGVLFAVQRGFVGFVLLQRPGISGKGATRSARCSPVRWCSRPLSKGRRRCS
jgi:hypothetical protein